ncbi:hypothetical protein AAH678_27640 [Sodalis endosymbiont of Spalangia cameroni]|uniref:hypothetical protein n=1 Tax=Sodalis praecaptivus TaxID=1239307 RepID=UPI0031F749FF
MNNFRVPLLTAFHILTALLTIFSIGVVFNYFSTGRGYGLTFITLLITTFMWFFLYFIYASSRKKVKNIINSVFGEHDVNKVVLIYNSLSGRCFCINSETGDILLIALNGKGEKVFGLDYDIWSGYEIEGSKLTLKFNNLAIPYFTIHDVTVPKFKHKLDVLLSYNYQLNEKEKNTFSNTVQQKLQPA